MTRALTARTTMSPMLGSARLPLTAVLAVKFATLVTEWHFRQRSRKMLSRLDDRMLEDIGVSYKQAMKEAKRPFWMI
ncbi:DUF1127 domain-containing protein [Chachezhania sediminis]|uniref:DUF1127 domain-containing protein n=1 Tax=Chachezhania sediminis TaxID=2599291 RepID=UPI001E484CAB|nr:DUF1127 domain-containing protein [Chachezhania sediminis]